MAVSLDSDLIAHWPLTENEADLSNSGLTARNCGVSFGPAPEGGPHSRAALFARTGAHLAVDDGLALQLGIGNFAVSVWIRTQDDGGTVGDVLTRFDTDTRTGFALSAVTNGGVTSTTQANHRHLQFGVDAGRYPDASDPLASEFILRDSPWIDRGRPGNAAFVYALHASGGHLYAGTFELEADQSGHLWLYEGECQWRDLGATPDGSSAVTSIARFGEGLYCTSARYNAAGSRMGASRNLAPGGTVWHVDDDGQWQDCGCPGEVDATPEEAEVTGYGTGKADHAGGLTVYRGELYATSYHRRGAFVYEGGRCWRNIGPDQRLISFTVYEGELYSLVNGGPVLRYAGDSTWEPCGAPEGSTQTYGSAIYGGQLHVSTWPEGEVHRYEGGEQWTNLGRVGYEREIMAMAVYLQKVYVGSLPTASVYRMDSSDFAFVGNLDSSAQVCLRRVWSMAVHDGQLFAGTLPSGHVHSLQAGAMATSSRSLPVGWHHLAAVRQGDRLHLYLDGRHEASSRYLNPADYDLDTDQPLLIGSGAHAPFRGAMSDLRLYGRALSAIEVSRLAGPS